MLGFWIGSGIIAILVILAFIETNLGICHPNEILVFSAEKESSRMAHKITIVDSGDGHGMPSYVKGVAASVLAIFEGN
jgi:hypothetical protein